MSDKKAKLYLAFKNKTTAEKWLSERGIDVQFDKSQNVYVYVRNGENEFRKNCKD